MWCFSACSPVSAWLRWVLQFPPTSSKWMSRGMRSEENVCEWCPALVWHSSRLHSQCFQDKHHVPVPDEKDTESGQGNIFAPHAWNTLITPEAVSVPGFTFYWMLWLVNHTQNTATIFTLWPRMATAWQSKNQHYYAFKFEPTNSPAVTVVCDDASLWSLK